MSIYLSDVRFNLVILYFRELNVYSIYYNKIKSPYSNILFLLSTIKIDRLHVII